MKWLDFLHEATEGTELLEFGVVFSDFGRKPEQSEETEAMEKDCETRDSETWISKAEAARGQERRLENPPRYLVGYILKETGRI